MELEILDQLIDNIGDYSVQTKVLITILLVKA